MELRELLDSIPADASETQVKNDYIYPHFMSNVVFLPESGETYIGITNYLETIDTEYQAYLSQIPDPLPPDYPVDFVIGFLQQQTAALNSSSNQETFVPVYYAYM